ncbi:hypothetical protein AGR4B_Cc70144 [Agrobacterium tumefaciens str. CFBP 5621]|nr:hypothetical protein AGR4B_Cc70144 [Agrobacterium tumefaciens str. CFBP 5621]
MQYGPSTLIPVLVTGNQSMRVCAAIKTLLSLRTWAGWIPVTSTGMRVGGVRRDRRELEPAMPMDWWTLHAPPSPHTAQTKKSSKTP